MTRTLTFAGLATALTLPLAAFAATLDADGDGAVTLSEFQDAMPDADSGLFAAIDVNADGVLTADETAAARDSGILPEG